MILATAAQPTSKQNYNYVAGDKLLKVPAKYR